jgi:hypothetical protein
MVRPEVVDYLRENLTKFQAEDLRLQLKDEGVTEVDFQDSLAVARSNPRTVTMRLTAPADKTASRLAAIKLALFLGSALLLVLGVMTLLASKPPAPAKSAAAATGESGFVGHSGWVVRLPPNYTGVTEFPDASKTEEIVHFCPNDTDPTNFIDEDLYGQLGIIRLHVAPSDFPQNPAGIAGLTRAITGRLRGEKYVLKNIQIATLPGVQVNVQSPLPRVEVYVLGQSQVYFFYGGQEDQVWRDIVLSLRDAHSEN